MVLVMLKSIALSFLMIISLTGTVFAMEDDLVDSPLVTKHTILVDQEKIYATNYLEITGVASLHKLGFKGANTKAIIIDNYIDPEHKALVNNLTQSIIPGTHHSNTILGHGTHVSGIIQEIVPEAEIKFISCHGGQEDSSTDALLAALEEAALSKGDVVNLSLTLIAKNFKPQIQYTPYDDIDPEIELAFEKIIDSGKAIFVALGNEYDFSAKVADIYSTKLMKLADKPEMKGMLTLVASSDYDCNGKERLASYSNRAIEKSSYVITAPGSDILSTMPDNKYASKSGTSMAAPVAVGGYLLLKSAIPGLEPCEYLKLIRTSARKKSLSGNYFFGYQYGEGILQIYKAFKEGIETNIEPNWTFVNGSKGDIDDWTFIEIRQEESNKKTENVNTKSMNEAPAAANWPIPSLKNVVAHFSGWWN